MLSILKSLYFYLILCIIFMKSYCDRGGFINSKSSPHRTDENGGDENNPLSRILQYYDWYTSTSTISPLSYTNQYSYYPSPSYSNYPSYTNQYSNYPLVFQNSFVPSSAYQDYYGKGPTSSNIQFPTDDYIYGKGINPGIQYSYGGGDEQYPMMSSVAGNHATTTTSHKDQHQHHHHKPNTYHYFHEIVRINKNGFGLLALLSLLGLFQSVLTSLVNLLTTTTSASTTTSANASARGRPFRNSRSISSIDAEFESEEAINQQTVKSLIEILIPNLNTIAYIREGSLPVECGFHEICLIEHILRKELKKKANLVIETLLDSIVNCLSEIDDKDGISFSKRMNSSKKKRNYSNGDCLKDEPICIEMIHSNGTIKRPPLLINQKQIKWLK